MKTSLKLSVIILVVALLWSACQFDIINVILCCASICSLALFLMILKINDNERVD